jgi:hypothetical protein
MCAIETIKTGAESKVQLGFSGNKCSHTQVTFVSLALGYFQDVIKGLFVAKESVFVVDFHAFAPRVMAKVQIAVL